MKELRRLGFAFRKKLDRTERWRRGSDSKDLWLSLRNELPEAYVRSTLRIAGRSEPEIDTFMAGLAGGAPPASGDPESGALDRDRPKN